MQCESVQVNKESQPETLPCKEKEREGARENFSPEDKKNCTRLPELLFPASGCYRPQWEAGKPEAEAASRTEASSVLEQQMKGKKSEYRTFIHDSFGMEPPTAPVTIPLEAPPIL